MTYSGPYVSSVRDQNFQRHVASSLDKLKLLVPKKMLKQESDFGKLRGLCKAIFYSNRKELREIALRSQYSNYNVEEYKNSFIDTCAMNSISEYINEAENVTSYEKFIISPWSNKKEIFSQLFTIGFSIFVLMIFFRQKNYIYELINSLKVKDQAEYINNVATILQENYLNRRKFHYCISGFVAYSAFTIQYYYVGQANQSAMIFASDKFSLVSYDYRLNRDFMPVFLVQLFLQIMLVFTSVLLFLETMSLNRCVRHVHEEMSVRYFSQRNKIEEAVAKINSNQQAVWFFLVASVVVCQGLISGFKFFDPRFSGMDQLLNAYQALDVSSILSLVYTFLPLIALSILSFFLTGSCYRSCAIAVRRFNRRRRSHDEKISEMLAKLIEGDKDLGTVVNSNIFKSMASRRALIWKTFFGPS